MIPDFRSAFNRNFTLQRYRDLLEDLAHHAGRPVPFRVAETPVFIPDDLTGRLKSACDEIIRVIESPAYLQKSGQAVPESCFVPGDEEQPLFLAFDFAICTNDDGTLVPKLIELQGFPSLFYYQHLLAQMYKKHFALDPSLNHLFGKSDDEYVELMKKVLLNGHDPEKVVLIDIEPEKQNTWIDFAETFRITGIRPVCISNVKRDGRDLYYFHGGRKIAIHRIYNRVIFDELQQRTDLQLQFDLTQDVDVEWTGHPNWFFRVSKFTMPFLDSAFVPETFFLNEVVQLPADLENYVLKPLFSFSGSGVIFHITKQDLEQISDPENWILQKKVNYAPVVESPDGGVKLEVRMLYCRAAPGSSPQPVINLCRLSKGEMIGVKYNRDKTWVGSSVGFMKNGAY